METSVRTLKVVSFGYKYGVPEDAGLVIDVRFLPNPYWVAELRPLTGKDSSIREYVFRDGQAEEMIGKVCELAEQLIPLYAEAGRSSLTVAVGCTGGRHRSVAAAEQLAAALKERCGITPLVEHRDICRDRE